MTAGRWGNVVGRDGGLVAIRAGCGLGDAVRRCLTERWVYADAACRVGIRRDLDCLLRCVQQLSPLPA